MPLIKDGAFANDTFAMVADNAALPDGATIVSLARFQKERDALLARNAPLGIVLKSAESPETLGEDVSRFSVIVLEFPVFRDGRAFSWSRMLRERFKYDGEIRARGPYLYDQIAMMHRTGFDAWEVPDGFMLERFQRALSEITNVYQPTADGKKTIRELRATKRT
ncbi:MAG TPA: DUF934 domain-containing protein [Rhizomicrobium sp.]|jgi:uncharacterized protein (DUF934 family)